MTGRQTPTSAVRAPSADGGKPAGAGRRQKSPLRRLAPAIAVVVLLLIVVLDTKIVSKAEFRRLNPPAFNPETYGKKAFPQVAAKVKDKAVDVTELAPAVEKDLPAAGKQYGQDLGSGSFSFPVKARGVAKTVDKDFVLLDVKGVPSGTAVRIPLGAALSGTPVRDATGTIQYGDFADQTDYQSAANQFKIRMQQDVLPKLDTKSLKGKTVTVYGGWSSGGPPKSFIIQPTSIEVSS
jgi:predicted lipoprotein